MSSFLLGFGTGFLNAANTQREEQRAAEQAKLQAAEEEAADIRTALIIEKEKNKFKEETEQRGLQEKAKSYIPALSHIPGEFREQVAWYAALNGIPVGDLYRLTATAGDDEGVAIQFDPNPDDMANNIRQLVIDNWPSIPIPQQKELWPMLVRGDYQAIAEYQINWLPKSTGKSDPYDELFFRMLEDVMAELGKNGNLSSNDLAAVTAAMTGSGTNNFAGSGTNNFAGSGTNNLRILFNALALRNQGLPQAAIMQLAQFASQYGTPPRQLDASKLVAFRTSFNADTPDGHTIFKVEKGTQMMCSRVKDAASYLCPFPLDLDVEVPVSILDELNPVDAEYSRNQQAMVDSILNGISTVNDLIAGIDNDTIPTGWTRVVQKTAQVFVSQVANLLDTFTGPGTNFQAEWLGIEDDNKSVEEKYNEATAIIEAVRKGVNDDESMDAKTKAEYLHELTEWDNLIENIEDYTGVYTVKFNTKIAESEVMVNAIVSILANIRQFGQRLNVDQLRIARAAVNLFQDKTSALAGLRGVLREFNLNLENYENDDRDKKLLSALTPILPPNFIKLIASHLQTSMPDTTIDLFSITPESQQFLVEIIESMAGENSISPSALVDIIYIVDEQNLSTWDKMQKEIYSIIQKNQEGNN